MKILLLADVPGWIVDRLCNRMVAEMPEIEWRQGYYACMSTDEILAAAADVDLVHYGNWDIAMHWPRLQSIDKPMLVSVRSHRYPASFVADVAPHVRIHAITRKLQENFPGSFYVPDGLLMDVRPLRVGFAGKPSPYKQTDMIEAACNLAGCEFTIASDLHPDLMSAWYQSIDVLVCASIAEGFASPVFEAIASRRPVISNRVGSAYEVNLPGVTWFDGTEQGLVRELRKISDPIPEEFLWPSVANGFRSIYREMAA